MCWRCVDGVGGGEEGTDVLCHAHRRLHTGAVSSDLLFVSVYLVENHRVWFSVAAGNLTAGQHDITRYLPKRRPE